MSIGVLNQHQSLLDAGRFLIQHCKACRQHIYFPREVCPHCGSGDVEFVEPSGLGTVYSTTTVSRKPDAGGDYNVCLIDLDEGPRLMSKVVGIAADEVTIGLRVQMGVEVTDGKGLVVATVNANKAILRQAQDQRVQAMLHSSRDNSSLRGSAAIVGVATFGCGELNGYTDMEILAESARRAVADAGLTMKDIDGLCSASVGGTMWAMGVSEYLGLNTTYLDGTMLGGSSFIAHLLPAMRALQSGQCNAVLVCYGSVQRSASLGRAGGLAGSRKDIAAARKWLDPQPFEAPYEPFNPPSAYALAAARHMHQYGTTRRDLAEVAVAARQWAQLNPEAFMQGPLSIDDVLAARMVSSPLSVRDCCLVTDGGGAYVLVRADRAKDLPKPPVYVLGTGSATWHRQISSMPDVTFSAAVQSGAAAYQMANLAPKDIGVLELYDAFTINTLLFLEDLGFCKKGEGGAFVQDGAIAPGGRLAVNTNGGGLSCVHPGMYGIFALIEAVRQLRGECGARQVAGIQTALAHGNGGVLSSQATAILGTVDTLNA